MCHPSLSLKKSCLWGSIVYISYPGILGNLFHRRLFFFTNSIKISIEKKPNPSPIHFMKMLHFTVLSTILKMHMSANTILLVQYHNQQRALFISPPIVICYVWE